MAGFIDDRKELLIFKLLTINKTLNGKEKKNLLVNSINQNVGIYSESEGKDSGGNHTPLKVFKNQNVFC